MLAAMAATIAEDAPLDGLVIGDRPDPEPPDGWVRVEVRAATLNPHDLWTLRGVGVKKERLPVVLGCDAAGFDPEGNEVIVHGVIASEGWCGDETLDPQRSLFSEIHDGTLANYVVVPRRNIIPKPSGLSFEEAACLPTAWLTAYRMLFTNSAAQPGATVLVQGAGGGVSTALIALGRASGYRMWVTSRSEEKRARALQLGADAVFETGARLPERVDAVMETVGAATWDHSLKSLRPGGTLVVAGATAGAQPVEDLRRVFFLQLRIIGSTMGTRDELVRLARLCEATGIKPLIDSEYSLEDARAAFARLLEGEMFGKIVVTV
jgi:NADPH:quinone reductase-like Zn-dependent oxidoreductase